MEINQSSPNSTTQKPKLNGVGRGIALGNSFDWADIACYALGSALCYVN